jgi:hypothetical protein
MNMNNSSPSKEEWAALYQAARAFYDTAPWEWMYDSDMFGLQNPESGEIDYCCVMGNLGEHYALGVYLGAEGLQGYNRIASGEFEAPDAAILHAQKCLMASFEDREYLQNEDRAVIKQLGLKFRGRNAWPLFRDYSPGYVPWFVTTSQARFLTHALQQALDVALRFRDDPGMLDPPVEGQYLVRVPEQNAGGLAWSEQWMAPAPLDQAVAAVPQIDELRVQRVKQSVTTRQGIWEADFFFSPAPIQDNRGQRPYFPYMLMWVDRRSRMILPPEMVPAGQYQAAFQNQLLALIEQAHFMPQEIVVLQQEALELLDPIAKRLGIKLRRARRLDALEEVRASMMDYFGQF